MKVYSLEDQVPTPKFDYMNFNRERVAKQEADHIAAIKAHLISMGYTGRYTGEVYREGVADGYAQYVVADGKGRYGPSFLVHLNHVDGYQSRNVQYVPKKDIIARIEQEKKIAKLFEKRTAVA